MALVVKLQEVSWLRLFYLLFIKALKTCRFFALLFVILTKGKATKLVKQAQSTLMIGDN